MTSLLMVCHLTPRKFGGYERFLVELGRQCKQDGVRLGLMLSGEPIAPVARALQEQGVRWWASAGWRRPGGGEDRSAFLRDFRRVNAKGPWDVVAYHFCSEVGVAMAIVLSRLEGRPRFAAVWHQHSEIAAAAGLKRYISRIGLLRPFVGAFVAPSRSGVTSLVERGCRPDRVRMIYNGCNIPEGPRPGFLRGELGVSASSTLILTVGSLIPLRGGGLVPLKGTDVLLEAIAPLMAGPGDRHLVIVGDGPLKDELRRRAETLSIGDRAHFLGLRDDVPGIMADCDLFVLPSRTESFGLVIIEAMAVGLPVVATRVGGIPDVVVDGETGLLVPPDDPLALRGALEALLDDERRARDCGEKGRQRCKAVFSVNSSVREHLGLYRALAEGLRTGRPAAGGP